MCWGNKGSCCPIDDEAVSPCHDLRWIISASTSSRRCLQLIVPIILRKWNFFKKLQRWFLSEKYAKHRIKCGDNIFCWHPKANVLESVHKTGWISWSFSSVVVVVIVYSLEGLNITWLGPEARETLTFTDIVLHEDTPRWLRMILCAMNIPWANHWTEREYRSKLWLGVESFSATLCRVANSELMSEKIGMFYVVHPWETNMTLDHAHFQ